MWLMAGLIVIVLILQARTLFIFPQPDSARWWGDETGQMIELRTELQKGYASIPIGIGSSVAVTNGLVRGNSWLAAVVYGVPALAFRNVADLVTTGRTITFILACILLLLMYRMMRSFGASPPWSLFAILLLITSRSFFFASHAARLDVAAGTAVLLFIWCLAKAHERIKLHNWYPSNRWFFSYGVVAMVSATLSIHLLTLVGALSIYMLWRFRAYRRPAALFCALGGVVLTVAGLLSIYALSGAEISLYGPSVASNQFQSVAGGLPILRPFSRSVQVANVLERLNGLWSEAPAILIFGAVAIILLVTIRKALPASPKQKFLSGAAIVILFAWLLLESPALYYFVQVFPIVIVALLVALASRLRPRVVWLASLIALLLSIIAIRDSIRASSVSVKMQRDNYAALNEAVDSIKANSSRSLVLAQNPAIALLEHEPDIRLMTPHIVSFALSRKPLPIQFDSLGVRYMLLYSPGDGNEYAEDNHVLRPIADSLGEVVFRRTGKMFDVRRDYFSPASLNRIDTVTLYRLKFAP
jgi:hypothetical protein